MSDLVLLTTDGMRARRHKWAVVGLWAWQTVLALLVAWPASSLVKAAYGDHPRGDAPLWDPGGRALADFLVRDAHGLRALASGASIVALAASVAGLVPMAAAMVAMAYASRDKRAPRLPDAMALALRALRALFVTLVIVGLAQIVVVVAGWLLARGIERWLVVSAGEARAQQIAGIVAVVFALLVSAIGVVHDLARAAAIRFKVGGLRALALGARTFRVAPASLWWSWAWRAAASLAPIAVAAPVAGRIGGRGGLALLCLAVLHQSVVLSRVALRASWLAKALRSVDGALRVAGSRATTAQAEAIER